MTHTVMTVLGITLQIKTYLIRMTPESQFRTYCKAVCDGKGYRLCATLKSKKCTVGVHFGGDYLPSQAH